MKRSNIPSLSLTFLALACGGEGRSTDGQPETDASESAASLSQPIESNDRTPVVVQPQPVLSQNEIDAIRAETKVVQSRAPHAASVGAWSRVSFLDEALVNNTFTVPNGTVAMHQQSADASITALPTDQRKVALRINDGLDHIGADVIPPLADEAGLDDLDLISSKTLFSSVGKCNTYQLKLRDVTIELPFGRTSVTGDFELGRKVKSNFNLPGAEARAELEWTITNTPTHWTCGVDPIPAMTITADFTVADLDGELDVTLQTDGSAIAVDTVDAVSFNVDDFDWGTNSWILDTVLTFGFGLYDLFDFTCSGQADCLSEAVNQYALTDDNLVDTMTAMVNDAIDAPLTISTGISSEGLNLSFSAALDTLQSRTSENTMTSIWDVTLGSTAPVDPCAASLFARSYSLEGLTGNAALTSNDLELELPFHLISKAAYFAGKQGTLCYSFNYKIQSVQRGFSVAPAGSIGVSGAGAGDPANTVNLSLPIRITPTSAAVTGTVNGTLNVKGSLSVDSQSDLVLTLFSASVSGLNGSVSVGTTVISAATLSGPINNAAATIVSNMNDIELLNAVVNTGIAGLSVSVGDILTSGSALVVGLDIE